MEVQWESSRGVSRCGTRGGFRAFRAEIPRGALAGSGSGMVVLTGLSGTGKSAALGELAAAGEQVLDLQALACHRGSAFGAFGLPPQPTDKQFRAIVRDALGSRDPARLLWVERCPRYLGSVGLPEELLEAMTAAPAVRLSRLRPERIAAIVAEYGAVDLDQWRAALGRISPRLGPARTIAVRAAVDAADLPGAVDVLLTYYDRCYGRVRGGGPPREPSTSTSACRSVSRVR
jgi:tRNA 2-selenouridine synthase